MANESQTTVSTQNNQEKSSFLSKIKWFFQKSKEGKMQRTTRAFHFTRKDTIISIVVSILVLWWAVYYWKIVIDQYSDLNNRSDDLKKIESYGVNLNWDKISNYSEWVDTATVNWMISVNDNIEERIKENEIYMQQQQSYFEVLLQNIYLPSLNVWKDPYTKNFNMWILWQRYLDLDKFQDLYLIQYWSDFAKYVWNDVDYNTIDNITIWDKVVLDEDPRYFYTPVTISFSSPNKRSFLLLVNKLSMTSNQSNIELIDQFFSILLKTLREEKSTEIDYLMQKYWNDFSSSSSWEFSKNLEELTEEQKSVYKDMVIWYTLYHWVQNDVENVEQLVDDDVILKSIKASVCPNVDLDQKCFYDFREKYRNLPYLAYKIWKEKQNNRTAWLLEFLQDLPPVIAITNFGFEKYSNSSFLNNKEEQYEWQITFNAYWRNILDSELEEASSMLWKLCFWNSSDQKISPQLALDTVSQKITSQWDISSNWWNREYSNISSRSELQWLFTSIQREYDGMTNYEKMVKLFEIWRMMNDATLCNK